MKRNVYMLIIALLMNGCADVKPPVESSPPPPCKEQSQQTITISSGDYELYLKAIAEQKSLYTEAIKSSNPTTPAAMLPSAPAAPPGSKQPLANLRTFIISVPEVKGGKVVSVESEANKFPVTLEPVENFMLEKPQPVDNDGSKPPPVVDEYDDVRKVVREAMREDEKKKAGPFDEGGVE